MDQACGGIAAGRPSLRDDLEAGRPASKTAGRNAGAKGEDVRVVVAADSAKEAAEAVKAAGGVIVTPAADAGGGRRAGRRVGSAG